MGTTMTFADLQGAFAMPKQLFAGILLQYTVYTQTLAAVSHSLLYKRIQPPLSFHSLPFTFLMWTDQKRIASTFTRPKRIRFM